MGVGHSHLAHPGHALRRSACCSVGAACGLCDGRVNLSEMAYRCTAADCTSFFLHDACYRCPGRIKKHFSRHSLALTARADVVTAGGCTVCAKSLDGFSYVYSCSQKRHLGCAGFRAHSRCGNLPRQASAPPHGHQLVLRAPGGAGAGGRRCLNCNNNNHAGGGAQQLQAWSYQCPTCQDVQLCLPCVLGGGDVVQCGSCRQCACGAGCFVSCAGHAGLAVGNFVDGFFRACIGFSFRSSAVN